jgi:hypothetical protein
MPGGFAVLQGPPGTSKTYMMMNCMLELLTYHVHAVDWPHWILIMALSYNTISHIAIMLKQLVEARLPQDRQRELVIVCCHMRTTKDKIALPSKRNGDVSIAA